jgi:hypothetical protein
VDLEWAEMGPEAKGVMTAARGREYRLGLRLGPLAPVTGDSKTGSEA